MVKIHHVEGYEAYDNLLQQLSKTNPKDDVFVMFSGSKDENQQSWCTDCREVEPIVEKVLTKFDDRDDMHFIHVAVGDRKTWKDPQCVFRTDPKLHLKTIPTLLRWGSSKRLEERECIDEGLVELLFEDD